jgi:hypothetical protein
MTTTEQSDNLRRIVESARRLGVELDEADALQWLAAISAERSSAAGDVVVDTRTGVFGHRVSMLDFSDADLAYFRRIGRIVEIPDEPGVETALALSGSAAQSKVQRYPGDCDYFERVNIHAPTREEACRRLGEVLRRKALERFKAEDHQLVEVHWGTLAEPIVKDGKPIAAGSSLSWTPADVQAGQIDAFRPDGQRITLPWSYGETDPGWCKLDWIVADPPRGQLANASNMLDVTWEAPDGTITPLDGFIDPYFQEVYLEADSIPVFTKLVKQVSADALDDYVVQLEGEVAKWAYRKPNYGKVAKRLYNIFRLTGLYAEAAYIRELFDEPTACLYQVWSLLSTVENVGHGGGDFDPATTLLQMDQLIKTIIDTCEGPLERQIVNSLFELKDSLAGDAAIGPRYYELVDSSQHAVTDLVNQYFRERLLALPGVPEYLEGLRARA